MAAELKAVIFDVDNTLFDRTEAQSVILRLMVREFPDIFTDIDEEVAVDAFLESDRISMQEVNDIATDKIRIRRGEIFLRILGLSEEFADKIMTMYVESYPDIIVNRRGFLTPTRSLRSFTKLAYCWRIHPIDAV